MTEMDSHGQWTSNSGAAINGPSSSSSSSNGGEGMASSRDDDEIVNFSSTSRSLRSSSVHLVAASEVVKFMWIHLLISSCSSKNLILAGAAAQELFDAQQHQQRQQQPHLLLLPGSFPGHEKQGEFVSPRCPRPDPSLNYRPVIGILSHPGDGASGRLNNATNASYIAASYVKFVEAAGARVIPLIYNEPQEVLLQKLNLVNGILFTGGWAKSGLYYETVEKIFKISLMRNDAGEHFPVLAICLGFEILTMIVSQDKAILESFSSLDHSSSLEFLDDVNIGGTVFKRFSPELLKKLTVDCLVMQNHQFGISPEKFQANYALSEFFKILTTSMDKNDKRYVSTIHADNYPITAFQWHPEKNAFEWGLQMIPHTEDAIQVTQNVANFFVSEARRSMSRPPARLVLDNLIYNFSPTFCGKAGKGYDEVYIFA